MSRLEIQPDGLQQETQQAQQQQMMQQTLADPRVAIEAGKAMNESGQELEAEPME